MASGDTDHVDDDEQTSAEPREINPLELIVALYQQGRSATEIRDLMDVPLQTVNDFVRAAGAIRTAQEAGQLSNQRWVARSRIARLPLAALAKQWIEGAEVEDLAEKLHVPGDLLWDALATQLSKADATKQAPKFTCAGTCSFGCIERCALTLEVSDRVARPGSARSSSANQDLRGGIPYVKLRLPEPGSRSQWDS